MHWRLTKRSFKQKKQLPRITKYPNSAIRMAFHNGCKLVTTSTFHYNKYCKHATLKAVVGKQIISWYAQNDPNIYRTFPLWCSTKMQYNACLLSHVMISWLPMILYMQLTQTSNLSLSHLQSSAQRHQTEKLPQNNSLPSLLLSQSGVFFHGTGFLWVNFLFFLR